MVLLVYGATGLGCYRSTVLQAYGAISAMELQAYGATGLWSYRPMELQAHGAISAIVL